MSRETAIGGGPHHAGYFLFFPFPPVLAETDELACRGVESTAAPCVAPPPPPLFRLPWLKVDRSLFLSHRSGSGGGVTPGITPGGTRRIRTFLGASFGFS